MATSSLGKPITFSLSQIGQKDTSIIEEYSFDPTWQASILDWLIPSRHFEDWSGGDSNSTGGHYLFHVPSLKPVWCNKFADLIHPECGRFGIAMFSRSKHRSGHPGGGADVREMISIVAAGLFNDKIPNDVEWVALEFGDTLAKTSECNEVFDRRNIAFIFDEEELGDYPEAAHSHSRVCPAKEFVDGFEENHNGGWHYLVRTKMFEDDELSAHLRHEIQVRSLAVAKDRIRFSLPEDEHSIEVFDALGLGKLSFELPEGISMKEVCHAEEFLHDIDMDRQGSFADYLDFSPLFPDVVEYGEQLCDDVNAELSIWLEFIRKANLALVYDFKDMSKVNFLAEIGRSMGLEWQFDAYMAKVPLEHILA